MTAMRLRLFFVMGALSAADLWAQQSREPLAVTGPRATVVALIPEVRHAGADSAAVTAWLEACGVRGVSAAPVPDVPTITRGALALVAIPRSAEPRCTATGERLGAWRGVVIDTDSTPRPGGGIVGISLQRDASPVAAREETRLPLRVVSDSGVRPAGSEAAVAFFALDDLPPDADGRFTKLRSIVAFADGTADTVALDGFVVAAAWESALALRVTGPDGTLRPTLRVPPATDAVIAQAQAAAARDDHRAAVRTATQRWLSIELSRDDRRAMQAQIGASLFALGDDAGARVAFRALAEGSPCVSLSADAPDALRAMVEGIARPPARCDMQRLPVTALRALALPGYGRPRTPGRRLVRAEIAGVVVVGLTTAILTRAEAERSYDQYLAFQAERPAGVFAREGADYWYRRSERVRRNNNALWVGVASVWAAQTIVAVVAERRYGRELDAQRGYGAAAPRVGLHLQPMPRALGVGVSVQW